MNKCAQCGFDFDISLEEQEFYKKFYIKLGTNKFDVFSKNCSKCREKNRMSFRNEKTLYRRECNASGKSIISIYSPDKPYIVYDQKVWYSDDWSALDYGIDFDFNLTFTQNFKKLFDVVPRCSLVNIGSENSEYCNPVAYNKNCYLIHASTNSNDCLYSNRIDNCNDCIDCLIVNKSSNCYECVDCTDCYECTKCINCESCRYCYNCYGLINKSYCISNKQYSKEEFFKYFEYKPEDNISTFPKKYLENSNSNNCIGNHLVNCNNCIDSWDVRDGLDIFHAQSGKINSSDILETTWFMNSHKQYECVSCINQNNCISCVYCWDSNNSYYSDACNRCSDIFGCVGIKDKSYCILNKEYSKDEYEPLVTKIIGHMQSTGERGEFFDSSLSPFGYNETVAMEYYPIGKIDALGYGYKRSEYKVPDPHVDAIIDGKDLPNSISDFTTDGNNTKLGINIFKVAIKCEITNKLFRITPQELKFYIKHNIPLPRKHPDQRHLDRIKLRNPRCIIKGKCRNCDLILDTTYQNEDILCDQCYDLLAI